MVILSPFFFSTKTVGSSVSGRSCPPGPSRDGVAVDAHGDLFIADSGNNVVEEVSPAGRLSVVAGNGNEGPPTPGPARSSDLDLPFGVAVDAHGDLFIGDTINNDVEKVTF
jgi:hypothetical protein